MDTAVVADGLCPLCLSEERGRAVEGARRFVNWFDVNEPSLRERFGDAAFYELQEIADQNREMLK
jgi:hypothetical protein